jgi:hypothetical protein
MIATEGELSVRLQQVDCLALMLAGIQTGAPHTTTKGTNFPLELLHLVV